ncbi:binding-protein-dependent transport systems inner membrane component [Ammonifex degensii KC4]|uniref:Binding-protein-dependent transport systems inner membrane component n=1 Tax=Ammonifex degensii (strain DSM 10501 / KC4) TaxID=429009 RepID=C9RC11_AMMDK|nr:binding-protein-dependent transport systems inner membrane component [Ammonifex degensii KC4]
MRGKDQIYWISLAGGGLVLFFLLYPLLHAFWVTNPSILIQTCRDREVIASLITSFKTAAAATAIATVTGVPFAYLLARREFKGKKLVEGLIDLPVVIPHTVAGIVLLMATSPYTWLGSLLKRAGLDFVGTYTGITIAMLFVSFPFLINAARDAFAGVPVRLEFVARTLGAGPLAVFFTVTLPLAWRGILTGMILTWARAVSEFGAVIILAYHPRTAPVLIYERFETYGLAYAQPIAILLLLVSLSVFVLARLVAGGKSSRAGSQQPGS